MNECSGARGCATEWTGIGHGSKRTGKINSKVANKIETQINK
jgi:hypothetical protein